MTLDLQHLHARLRGDVQTFTTYGPNEAFSGVEQWQTWRRPRTASMIYILCIGGGGGGGVGSSAAANSQRGGGGSGGSSGHTVVVIPAFLLPEVLYLRVGAGGAGGVAGGSVSGNGTVSYVCIAPMLAGFNIPPTSNTLAVSGASSGAGGGFSNTSAGGTGGAGGTSSFGMSLAGLGFFTTAAGQSGVAGGDHVSNGTAITIPTTGALCQAGSGGAGTDVSNTDRVGGAFTAIADTYISEQRPATPAAGTNGHGSGGTRLPFFHFGGGGGSSSGLGTGANGGHGDYGGGGGGSGAGVTAGRGGDGGSGIIIIAAW